MHPVLYCIVITVNIVVLAFSIMGAFADAAVPYRSFSVRTWVLLILVALSAFLWLPWVVYGGVLLYRLTPNLRPPLAEQGGVPAEAWGQP